MSNETDFKHLVEAKTMYYVHPRHFSSLGPFSDRKVAEGVAKHYHEKDVAVDLHRKNTPLREKFVSIDAERTTLDGKLLPPVVSVSVDTSQDDEPAWKKNVYNSLKD